MLVGSALPVAETMGGKQAALVEELRREFGSLREREANLRARLAELEEEVRLEGRLAEHLTPALVRGRLAGIGVVLLTAGNPALGQIEGTLAAAGATVLARGPLPDGEAGVRATPAWLPGGQPAGAGGGTAAGREVPTRVLFLVGDGRPRVSEDALAALAAEARARGWRLVAAETRRTRPSLVPLWRRLGVPSVDDVDVLAGRLALVALLAGEDGHYGVKPTADGFLPPAWAEP